MKITVPTELNDMTVSQYQYYHSTIDKEQTDDFKMIALFCNTTVEVVKQMDVEQLERISITIRDAFNSPKDFVNRFKLNGVEYGFMPNLDKMSVGEFIDLMEFLPNESDLNKLMGVMFRPIERKVMDVYDIEPYEGDKYFNIMKEAPLGVALASQVFFLNLGKELLKAIHSYSKAGLMKMTIQQKQILEKSMDGIKAFTL